jgi:hypothetical protein
MICTFCSNHKLQILIGVFWVLDATTFLLLHTGTLVSRCSVSFFVLMALPAIFAVVFVGLGRCHLLSLRARSDHRRLRGFDDVERRPLLTTFFSNSSDADDNGDGDDDPIPNPIESGRVTTSPAYRRQNSPWMQDQRWVLLVPLVSTVAGVLRALKLRSRRRYQRNQGGGLNAGPSDMAESLLSPDDNQEFPSNEEESSIQDDYKSLLSWWLPWASVLIGLLAALLGIGGGELLGPILLLLLQMNPQESSATTAIMSMMNSGTNLLHYIVAGMIVAPGYAINLGFMGLLGGSMGRLWATSIAQQGRTSIIAMSLCLVLSLATALVAWELVTTPISWKSSAGVC